MLNYKFIDNTKENTIVLFHGIGGSNNCFKYQINTCSKYFNVLMIDLHGHGISNSYKLCNQKSVNLETVIEDVISILDMLNIKSSHYMGLSLGTIVINALLLKYPERIKSIVQVGAIVDFDNTMKVTLDLINKVKNILPYMFIYTLLGFALMPTTQHIKSRAIFVKEAIKLGQLEFIAWFNLMKENFNIYDFKECAKINIPKLYITGEHDKRFLKLVRKYIEIDTDALSIELQRAGHICNIDNPFEFNQQINNFFKTIV